VTWSPRAWKVRGRQTEQGISYAMPALLYRGKGLIATVCVKKFLSLYPYSGAVFASVLHELGDFETTSGSIHYFVKPPAARRHRATHRRSAAS